MHHRHSSSYSYSASAVTKYPNGHGTSSAFSASANPDEDWTKISDLAERRRIQNRIAQRNYRKKLKRRLEDLERRAASNSVSPPQVHRELESSSSEHTEYSNGAVASVHVTEAPADHRHISPELLSSSASYISTPPEEQRSMYSYPYSRSISNSPPPYGNAYPVPEQVVYTPYPQHAPYHNIPTTTLADYLPSLNATLPSMSSTVTAKTEPLFDDDTLSPFNYSYAVMAGMEIPTTHAYSESNSHTPPLSSSFDHSSAGTPESSSMFPPTPASIPGSPLLHLL